MKTQRHTHPFILFVALAALTVGVRASDGTEAWTAAIERAKTQDRRVLPEEDAAGAVNGIINGQFSFHTAQDDNPFWQVDLGATSVIGRVVVYNTGHAPERALHLELFLSDDAMTWRRVYAHDGTRFIGADGSPLVVSLPDEQARHVRVQLPGSTWLHLDQVQVFGPDKETNLALKRPATQSSVSQWSTRSIRIEQQPDSPDDEWVVRRIFAPLLAGNEAPLAGIQNELEALLASNTPLSDIRWAALHTTAVHARQQVRAVTAGLARFNPRAMRMAIEDLGVLHPDRFPNTKEQLARLARIEAGLEHLRREFASGSHQAWEEAASVVAFQRELLLRNPLLDFDGMLVLRRNLGNAARSVMSGAIGLASNFHANDAVPAFGWDNEIAILRAIRRSPRFETLHRPEDGRIVADLALDFCARQFLFASIGERERAWRIFEMGVDGRGLTQVTPDDGEDIAHSDPCYLPDGRIVFASNANYVGLPCVFGAAPMVCLYRLDRDTGKIRQLTFEQDSDWSPTVTPGGRVMYQRWEYADLPHSNSRILFHMNPDGTGQIEYYGSNSYFPPSFFYARSVPNHPTMVAGIVTGHHGTHRSGRLLLIDPALGRHEADGVVQEIPGWGRTVEPIVADRIVDGVWPHFLHPHPLNETHFIVTMKENPEALWGIYLVDVFDNITLIAEVEGTALLHPIPLTPRPRPPIIHDKVDLDRDDAVVMIGDVYRGPGLAGIPRGQVKELRLISYYWSSRGMGGLLGSIGIDGPWDIKRILGTVPVEPDGSAHFRIPANKPITLQPLDAEGKALQLKRTWIVGMPGEVVSCAGCHESQNTAPPIGQTIANLRAPSTVKPWYGPTRGFAFHREVQPVLDRRCVECHNGQPRADGISLIDLSGTDRITDWSSQISGNVGYSLPRGGEFSTAYAELHRYVRRPGIESDLHLLTPGEFHADTTELVQMLRDGRHHGVKLNREDWDRLIAWIDLNTPYHGTWSEIVGPEPVEAVMPRRMELSQRYAGIVVDYEKIHPTTLQDDPDPPHRSQPRAHNPHPPAAIPPSATAHAGPVTVPGWPFDADEARRRQGSPDQVSRTICLGEGIELELVRIPAGRFVMGQPNGTSIEAAPRVVTIDHPFYIGRFEVSNAQFERFDPQHDSRHESRHGYQFGRKGYPVNHPDQPVVRVSWHRAMAFCRWLSERTDLTFTLPTEAQWEWAARAGTDTPFFFGCLEADYSHHANFGDIRLREYAACTAQGDYTQAVVIQNPSPYDDWVPRDDRFDDGHFLSAPIGSYKPNPWGLFDMLGNVWEWTRTETNGTANRMIVRGGSWRDRPHRGTAAARLDYRPYHQVFNVGFRVIAKTSDPKPTPANSRPAD